MSTIMIKDGSMYRFVKIRNIKIHNNVLKAEIQIKARGKYIEIAIPLTSITIKYNDIVFKEVK